MKCIFVIFHCMCGCTLKLWPKKKKKKSKQNYQNESCDLFPISTGLMQSAYVLVLRIVSFSGSYLWSFVWLIILLGNIQWSFKIALISTMQWFHNRPPLNITMKLHDRLLQLEILTINKTMKLKSLTSWQEI